MSRRAEFRRWRPIAAVLAATSTLVVGALTPASADHANTTAVDGLAFNYATNVSLFGGASDVRGHGQDVDTPSSASPSLRCPPTGGSDTLTDADGSRAAYGPAVVFGGRIAPENTVSPPSGPLTSTIDCRPGDGGRVTASTSITLMPAGSTWVTPGGSAQPHVGGVGPGPFAADEVHSTCTANADGTWTASARVVKGVLETRYDPETGQPVRTEALPLDPAPNDTREGTIDHVGDRYRVVFNEHVLNADGSVTVNAAHVYLLGPTAVGDMVIGSSTCGRPPAAAVDHDPVPPAETSSMDPQDETSPTAGSARTPAVADAPSALTTSATESSSARQQETTATAPSNGTGGPEETFGVRAQTMTVSSVVGGAFGYHVNVGLFGGPARAEGPAPTVTLPASGSAAPVTAQDADGAKAQYGPAVIFGGVWPSGTGAAPASGPITVSTQGTTGVGGSVTSSTGIVLHTPRNANAPGGIGPGPLISDEVHATCTANAQGATGSARFVNGTLETKYDPDTQEPTVTEKIPVNPAPNYTRTGTIDHVGDSYRIVFNEQTRNPDGSLTLNAAHMYLLGPIAVGEMIVGQVRCGVTASAVSTGGTQGSATGAGAGTGTGSGGTAGTGAAAGAGSTGGSGESAAVAGESAGVSGAAARAAGAESTGSTATAATTGSGSTRRTGSGASGAGNPLAHTGGETAMVLALALMVGALAAARASRRPVHGATHADVDGRR